MARKAATAMTSDNESSSMRSTVAAGHPQQDERINEEEQLPSMTIDQLIALGYSLDEIVPQCQRNRRHSALKDYGRRGTSLERSYEQRNSDDEDARSRKSIVSAPGDLLAMNAAASKTATKRKRRKKQQQPSSHALDTPTRTQLKKVLSGKDGDGRRIHVNTPTRRRLRKVLVHRTSKSDVQGDGIASPVRRKLQQIFLTNNHDDKAENSGDNIAPEKPPVTDIHFEYHVDLNDSTVDYNARPRLSRGRSATVRTLRQSKSSSPTTDRQRRQTGAAVKSKSHSPSPRPSEPTHTDVNRNGNDDDDDDDSKRKFRPSLQRMAASPRWTEGVYMRNSSKDILRENDFLQSSINDIRSKQKLRPSKLSPPRTTVVKKNNASLEDVTNGSSKKKAANSSPDGVRSSSRGSNSLTDGELYNTDPLPDQVQTKLVLPELRSSKSMSTGQVSGQSSKEGDFDHNIVSDSNLDGTINLASNETLDGRRSTKQVGDETTPAAQVEIGAAPKPHTSDTDITRLHQSKKDKSSPSASASASSKKPSKSSTKKTSKGSKSTDTHKDKSKNTGHLDTSDKATLDAKKKSDKKKKKSSRPKQQQQQQSAVEKHSATTQKRKKKKKKNNIRPMVKMETIEEVSERTRSVRSSAKWLCSASPTSAGKPGSDSLLTPTPEEEATAIVVVDMTPDQQQQQGQQQEKDIEERVLRSPSSNGIDEPRHSTSEPLTNKTDVSKKESATDDKTKKSKSTKSKPHSSSSSSSLTDKSKQPSQKSSTEATPTAGESTRSLDEVMAQINSSSKSKNGMITSSKSLSSKSRSKSTSKHSKNSSKKSSSRSTRSTDRLKKHRSNSSRGLTEHTVQLSKAHSTRGILETTPPKRSSVRKRPSSTDNQRRSKSSDKNRRSRSLSTDRLRQKRSGPSKSTSRLDTVLGKSFRSKSVRSVDATRATKRRGKKPDPKESKQSLMSKIKDLFGGRRK